MIGMQGDGKELLIGGSWGQPGLKAASLAAARRCPVQKNQTKRGPRATKCSRLVRGPLSNVSTWNSETSFTK